MSVDITIHPKGLLKKNITLQQVLMNKFRYGVYDSNYILEEGKQGENEVILYHPEHIARGISVVWKDNKDIELSILLPTTNEEIDDLYTLITYLCQLCHTKEFIQDDVVKSLRDIESIQQGIKEFNYDTLNQFLNEHQTGLFFCAMWPMHFRSSEVKYWLEDPNLSSFSKELHQFQAKDLYYANAICYQMKHNDGTQSIMGVYVVTATVDTIFPLKPMVPFSCTNLQTGEQIQVDNYVVSLASVKQDKILGEVSFDDFMKELMKKEVHEFDDTHIYFDGLSEEDIQRIYDLYHETA